MIDSGFTIKPIKHAGELNEGESLIAIVLYSVLLSPCSSVLFRMFFGAAKKKLASADVAADWGGLFGMHFALAGAMVSDRCAAIEAAKELLGELNISDETYIGYYDKSEGAWRMAHCGATGWNLPFEQFLTDAALRNCEKLLADEKEVFAGILRIAQRESGKSNCENAD